MRKVTALISFLVLLILVLPAFGELSKKDNSRDTMDLVSGKKLVLPPFPGLVRVDGLHPEIDDLFIPEQHRNRWAEFLPTEKVWVEHYNTYRQGLELEELLDPELIELTETLWIGTYNDKHTGDKVQDAVDIWHGTGPENRITFSDVPDSEFWYSDGTDTKYSITKHLSIHGYTILDNQIIMMTFVRIPEEPPVTKEWIAVQEKKVTDWVRELRKINNY